MIHKIKEITNTEAFAYLIEDISGLNSYDFSSDEINYFTEAFKSAERELLVYNKLGVLHFVVRPKHDDQSYKILEKCRVFGDKILQQLNDNKIIDVTVVDLKSNREQALSLSEGIALSNYQFNKYQKESDKKNNSLKEIFLYSEGAAAQDVEELNAVVEAQAYCRDLVNAPLNKLNATELALSMQDAVKDYGVKVEILNKSKIEALKMGGLLGVNMGSIDPPTFTILEYKSKTAVNDKPYVLVGKGVVYDTGGMNLKTGSFMDNMKCDMAGAASMVSVVKAVAQAELPIYVVALIPATDNRVNGNALVSGDVITISNGKTVEVLNTDAEGRLILADALSYASKLDPELVIDMATLTGSAVRAIGQIAMAGMHVKAKDAFERLVNSGFDVYERIVEFPMWDEYGEWLKSDIADLKNLGPAEGGMITAGKFLEAFTNYPYIHLDIAGPAFITKKDSYRGHNATGVGVRLLFDFLKKESRKA
ncbi:MAG: leucyl aminopeptidase [Bacteroidales bacterium]|nr:leucyl aminopeptidase [Bacteroidales bacterium]